MGSIDVVAGQDILAIEYNLLRFEAITNASAIDVNAAAVVAAATVGGVNAEDIITTAGDLTTHETASAAVHGLAAGIDVLGVETAGLHIQYARGASTWSHAGGQNERHYAYAAWPTGFTNLYAVASSVGVGSVSADSAYMTAVENVRYSTVGATARVNIINSQGENTSMQLDIIGIGI